MRHGAIYHPDSFVLMLSYCANLKAIRYESTSLNRIVADKSHRVIVALLNPEHLAVLLAGPISHTDIQCMDFVEIFTVSLDLSAVHLAVLVDVELPWCLES